MSNVSSIRFVSHTGDRAESTCDESYPVEDFTPTPILSIEHTTAQTDRWGDPVPWGRKVVYARDTNGVWWEGGRFEDYLGDVELGQLNGGVQTVMTNGWLPDNDFGRRHHVTQTHFWTNAEHQNFLLEVSDEGRLEFTTSNFTIDWYLGGADGPEFRHHEVGTEEAKAALAEQGISIDVFDPTATDRTAYITRRITEIETDMGRIAVDLRRSAELIDEIIAGKNTPVPSGTDIKSLRRLGEDLEKYRALAAI